MSHVGRDLKLEEVDAFVWADRASYQVSEPKAANTDAWGNGRREEGRRREDTEGSPVVGSSMGLLAVREAGRISWPSTRTISIRKKMNLSYEIPKFTSEPTRFLDALTFVIFDIIYNTGKLGS